jgi:hypothetical protein
MVEDGNDTMGLGKRMGSGVVWYGAVLCAIKDLGPRMSKVYNYTTTPGLI